MPLEHCQPELAGEAFTPSSACLSLLCLRTYEEKFVTMNHRRTQMIREGKLSEVDSISELGIYGVFLRKGNEIILNEEAGHLVRTKVNFSFLCLSLVVE